MKIVIFIPGTGTHTVRPEFIKAVGDRAKVLLCKYPASKMLVSSSAEGARNLKEMVTRLKKMYPKALLYAVGESQGAMAIAQAGVDHLLRGAILVGAPGFVKSNWPRYQHALDFVPKIMPDEMPEMVEKFMKGNLCTVGWFAGFAVRHPLAAITAALSAIDLLDRHDYAADMDEVADQLLDEQE